MQHASCLNCQKCPAADSRMINKIGRRNQPDMYNNYKIEHKILADKEAMVK